MFPVDGVDLQFDACRSLPFEDGELKAIVMGDVLHHLPDVESFFKEARDKLCRGGRIIMIEPWNSKWASFVYRKLHHEPFDIGAEEWRFPSKGPLSSANGALPWMIFSRDLDKFQQKFPELHLVSVKKLMPLSYLLSGGVSMRGLLPGFLYGPWRGIEGLSGLDSLIPMFATMIIEKDN